MRSASGAVRSVPVDLSVGQPTGLWEHHLAVLSLSSSGSTKSPLHQMVYVWYVDRDVPQPTRTEEPYGGR